MKIQHTLMSIKKAPQKQTHRTPQTLPAIYLTNELIFSDATLQRCEWKQTLHSHKMNDCFHSYSARIFFFCTKRKGFKKKKQTPQNLFLNINVKKIFLRKKKKKKTTTLHYVQGETVFQGSLSWWCTRLVTHFKMVVEILCLGYTQLFRLYKNMHWGKVLRLYST